MPETAPKVTTLFSLTDKTALIIGGSGLLGGEIAFAFAELGANLVIASRDINKCQNMARKIKASFPHINIQTYNIDITNPTSVNDNYQRFSQAYPNGLDILVNCGWSGKKNTFDSISEADWNTDIETCLNGVFRTIKCFAPLIKKKKGNILNIASMYGYLAPDYRLYDSEKYANPPSYGAAKAGIIQLTKYLASFLAPDGIRVNAISPGPFPFESTQQENPAFIARLAAKNPLNRVGKPHEIKGIAALLCSEAGSYITGQNICVDGGWGIW
jgi:NAD(P)-dependent dehydrogenase (short-subunit alcohol dehydrogenase family)